MARADVVAGANQALIIDPNANCGGTHSLIAHGHRFWQLDIAIDTYDSYTPNRPNTFDYSHYHERER